MGLMNYFRTFLSGATVTDADDQPTFRCLRCGTEFARQYAFCPECNVKFVVEVPED